MAMTIAMATPMGIAKESAATPAPTKHPAGRETATRVVVPALGIDLPVISGTDTYPYCNVAMYLTSVA